ncbi:MAG: M28 family peptidase [Chloroflexi bacterium]|nr:M28 family peptidase [Chloroflexota bacterium]
MTTHNWAKQAFDHARLLSEQIGPRGATSPEEQRAAEYARDQLQQSGISNARVEAFRSPRSGWLPLTIAFSVAVWSTIICWAGFYLIYIPRSAVGGEGSARSPALGALIGAILCAFSAWTIYRLATYHQHPLHKWLSTATSHNAVGHIAAAGPATQHVVLVANVDTAPDSWVFRTPRRTRLFYGALRLAAASLLLSIIFFVLGALEAWGFAFVAAGLCGFVQSAGILLTIQADQGDFSAGANDNASGVGVVLALAQQLREAPLKQTEVWVVLAGSHTLGNGGLRSFMQQQPDLAKTAWFVGCQQVGLGDRVAYVRREGWLPRTTRADVRNLIERAATDRAGQSPRPITTPRATPIGAALWRGCKSVCVVMDKQAKNGKADEAVTRLQLPALQQAHDYLGALLKMIDGQLITPSTPTRAPDATALAPDKFPADGSAPTTQTDCRFPGHS